ncbi:MAG TPA: hypothetical protein VIR28_03870 [Achromobacter sp.]
MKALCWHGKHDVRYDTVPDPILEDPRDAIIKVSACAICGSDLHLFDGFMPGMKSGDIGNRSVACSARNDYVCRPGETLSIPGVYGGMIDKIPFGASMNKGLTWRMGQTHVRRWTDDLLKRIADKQIDPSFVITHRAQLQAGPDLYKKNSAFSSFSSVWPLAARPGR